MSFNHNHVPVKKLYRSENKKMFGGVLGGLGEYFAVDPTILRLGWVFITVFTGVVPGVVVYLIAWILIPRKPDGSAEVISLPEADSEKQS